MIVKSNNMKNPFFSICIPYYNVGSIFERCLDSINCQSYTNYEVIVVNDGSNSHLTVDDAKFARLLNRMTIISIENSGPYVARQTAVHYSNGEYIYFMDADDAFYSPSSLEMMRNALNERPDVLLLNAVSNRGNKIIHYDNMSLNDYIDKRSLFMEFLTHPEWGNLYTMVFAKKIFVPNSARPRLMMAEDRLQKGEILFHADTVLIIDLIVYKYFENTGSIMHSKFRSEYLRNRLYVEETLREYSKQLDIPSEYSAKALLQQVIASLLDIRYSRDSELQWRINSYKLLLSCADSRWVATCRFDLRFIDLLCLSLLKHSVFYLLDIILTLRMKLALHRSSNTDY